MEHTWNGVIGAEDAAYDGSVPASGYSAISYDAISGDGRFITFYSSKTNIIPGDTNGYTDAFVRDRWTQQIELISAGMSGAQANGSSDRPVISANGRHVAFRSNATNLAPGDTNDGVDIFVRDRLLGTTSLVSIGPSGEPARGMNNTYSYYNPSADGRFIAFVAAFNPNSSDAYVWLRDRDTDGNGVFDEAGGTATTQISPAPVGSMSAWATYKVAVSGNARIIAYNSRNSLNGTNGMLYAYDRETGLTTRIDVPASGLPDAAGESSGSDLDYEGRYLAYTSTRPNIVADDGDTYQDLFLCDLQTGSNSRLLLSHDGAPTLQMSHAPSISGDGRYVSFMGSSTPYGSSFSYLIDLQTGFSREIRFDANETADSNPVGVCGTTINGDGSSIVFMDCGDTWGYEPPFRRIFVAMDLSLSPNTMEIPAEGNSFTMSVYVPDFIPWTAQTPDPESIALSEPPSGAGSGIMLVDVLPNYSGADRDLSIYVGSEKVQLHQAFAPLAVSSVAPAFGPLGGGTVVQISGQAFVEGPTVTFGGIQATDVSVVSFTTIQATTPPGAGNGAVDVVVTNPDGSQDSLPAAFTYKDTTPPVITPHISGTMGENGWYVSDVTLSWDVVDPESAIEYTYMCNTRTITYDGSLIEISCSARSAGGYASAKAQFKRDGTAPYLGTLVPRTGVDTFGRGQQVASSYSCEDPAGGSGLAQCSGPVPSGSNIDTSQAGTFAFTITARDVAGNQSTFTQSYTVTKTDPVITWAQPDCITYPTPLGAMQLNATADVSGTFSYSPVSGMVLLPGDHILNVTFTPDDAVNYATATKSITLAVLKIGPKITWLPPASINYGTPLSATQLNAIADVPGAFTYRPPAGTILSAGTHTLVADFVPNDRSIYADVSWTVSILIKAVPTITWATPSSIPYETMLSSTQLNATASVPGTFTYTPTFGTVLPAGSHTLTVNFVPNDTANYANASASVSLIVTKRIPALTWSTPSNIIYGTPLGAAQLNAGATIPGAFTYTPAAGTILPAGSQLLGVLFTPQDTANYQNVNFYNLITVLKATPAIAWAAPASIVYGTPLSAAQLNASANVAGTFTYSPGIGTFLTAGIRTLSAVFAPADSANYNQASANVLITVTTATLTVQVNNAGKVYGEALPVFTATVSGLVAGDTVESLGGLTYTTSATASSAPGAYQVSAGGLSPANYLINIYPGTLWVTKASTGTTLTMTPNPSTNRQTVQLTATVGVLAPGAGSPTGSVRFYDNDAVLGTASLVNGVAALNVKFKKGTHPLKASYLGDNVFTGSSGTGTQQVR